MSKIPIAGSKGVPPRTGAIPRPSNTGVGATGGKSATSKSSIKKCPGPPKESKKRREFDLPPLSTLRRETEEETDFQKLKQKTIRRNAGAGEDLKMIKDIMKSIKDQEITVHEFVGLVAPYTGDNGTLLRTVLASELSHFRTLARKIYDNMTQDISDVLTNEHIQLTESSKEKHALYGDKMMRAIDEIYEHCPKFSFEKYYTDPNYLETVFPRATEAILDEDREQQLMRQEAYHRMMWLRSEGDRLGAENKKLHGRLKELKGRLKEEMQRASTIDRKNDEKRKELEDKQDRLQEQLDEMNTSIEKAIVEQEINVQEHELEKIPPIEQKPMKVAPKSRTKAAENWNVRAAAEIEETTTTEALVAESSRVSVASSKSSTGAIPKATRAKRKKKKQKGPAVPQEGSPFHYSPPRTPPGAEQQTSPFHYSPPKTPRAQQTTMQDEAGGLETTRVTTTTTTLQQAPAPLHGQRGVRRSLAPRDSWGGFR